MVSIIQIQVSHGRGELNDNIEETQFILKFHINVDLFFKHIFWRHSTTNRAIPSGLPCYHCITNFDASIELWKARKLGFEGKEKVGDIKQTKKTRKEMFREKYVSFSMTLF